MNSKQTGSKSAKVLYRPVGMASSILGGMAASMVFKQVWKHLAPGDHPDPPKALESRYSLRQILIAAAIQGAIYSLVKTLIDRAGARVFQRWSGDWPGN